MSDLKTQKTRASVKKFLDGVGDEQRRKDCRALARLFEEVMKEKPAMWGPGIVGFGTYHYRYASGREGDWFQAGFAPRKDSITIYAMPGFDGYEELMAKLGRYKTGKACIFVKKLEDIHLPTLKKLIRKSAAHTKKIHA